MQEKTELNTSLVKPEIGEIKRGKEIGYKSGNLFIWRACIDCNKERWVLLKNGKPDGIRCNSCRASSRTGQESGNWKGGRRKSKGYIDIKVYPDDFFYPMATKSGYVREHRLVVAKALGRCLLPWEIVHHKGKKYPQGSIENKSDNRYPENLELLPAIKYHLIDTISRSRIAQLEKRVTSLEAENIILYKQLEESLRITAKKEK